MNLPSELSRTRVAFADESQSNRALDPDTYVLAAVVCEAALVEEVRMSTARLRADRQRKVHWRDESDRRRRVIADAVGAAPIGHLVVVREGRSGERPERQRRQCMTRLLYELDQLDVATITFESRGSADDRKDRVMLDALRSRRTVSASLRMDHLPGPAEPLLWAADVLCGAVVQHRLGDPRYLSALSARTEVTVIKVGLDPLA